MSHRNTKQLIKIWISALAIAVIFNALITPHTNASEGHPGPQMADIYASWAPGNGPDGANCLLNGVDLNAFTGFEGGFVTLACNQLRAGDFWSTLFTTVNTETFLRNIVIPNVELGVSFYEFVVDAGTAQESSYVITFKKGLIRDEEDAPIIFDVTDLFPNDVSGNKMLVFYYPLPPERVGTHTVDIYETVPPRGVFDRFVGRRTWEVTPK
ncbi:hypothetical protein F9K50_04065 [bacterium]|nr:MAG: hypothetical protein F9K50_04065 [bacterium]